LGDSDQLVPGQTVLAIGNALGQFEGTVSTGIISGLSRMVSAYGFGYSDVLTDLIQTDAAINHGNSGGPLLDLNGQVVGVNVAMAEQAQNVGFAIPINQAKRAIKSFQETGRIVYPFLGISYVMVDQDIQEEHQLDYDYGALIVQDPQSGVSVMSGSTAEAMGLREGDVILEFNGQKVTADQMLGRIIQEYDPGDQIILKVWRQGQILTLEGSLGQREG
jgi:S1-C subfamily serine protease